MAAVPGSQFRVKSAQINAANGTMNTQPVASTEAVRGISSPGTRRMPAFAASRSAWMNRPT